MAPSAAYNRRMIQLAPTIEGADCREALLSDADLGLYAVCSTNLKKEVGRKVLDVAFEHVQEAVNARKQVLEEFGRAPNPGNLALAVDLAAWAVETAANDIHALRLAHQDFHDLRANLAVLLWSGNKGVIAYVGDCRICLYRQNQPYRLTLEPSKLRMSTRKEVTATSLKNNNDSLLAWTMGSRANVQVETLPIDFEPNDVILMSTSSLHERISDEKLQTIMREQPFEELPAAINRSLGKDATDPDATPVGMLIHVGHDPRNFEPDTLKRAQAMRQVSLFDPLNYGELLELARVARNRTFRPGEQLIYEGQPDDDLMITLRGSLKVLKGGKVLAMLPPGSLVGELNMFDRRERSADVVAMEEGQLLVLKRKGLEELIEANMHLGLRLMRCFCRTLSSRLRQTTEEVAAQHEAMQVGLSASENIALSEIGPWSFGNIGA